MGDDGRYKIEKFNGTNFAFWKMQMEDLLYQKKLYLPLGGVAKKPEGMKDEDWEVLDRTALGTIRLTLAASVAFNIVNEKTTKDLMAALTRMYEKPSASNKVFLMKRLFNMRMVDGSSVAEHLNNFNSLTNQLSSVNIKFEDEIRALLLLSSLPDSWDGLVTAVSNSSGNAKLVFEDIVGLILNEEVRKKSSGEVSNSALNFETRGRSDPTADRGRSKSSKGKVECWNCGKKGHLKKDCFALKKAGGKGQEEDPSVNVSEYLHDALILSLDSTESWIVDSGASFHASPNKSHLKNFVQVDLGKVYVGDDKACSIDGKGDADIQMPNGSVWKLKDVRFVPSLRRNLISVSQLACDGFVTTFAGESWKVTKGALVVAQGKMDGTLYSINKISDFIAVAGTEKETNVWHRRLGHMSKKGMKSLFAGGKLPGLRSVDLDLCDDCLFGKLKMTSFSKAVTVEKLKLCAASVGLDG